MKRLMALLPVLLLLNGCHYLLLLPCGTGCSDWVSALPPHDNVMSFALNGADPLHPEGPLTAVARQQYLVLDRKWPPVLDCAWLAQPGCNYSIAVQEFHRDGLRVDDRNCTTLDFVVEEGTDGPVVRRTGSRPLRCPEGRSRQ